MMHADQRLSIRVSTHEKDKLRQAARLENTTITNFVLTAALVRADEVISRQEVVGTSNLAERIGQIREDTRRNLFAAWQLGYFEGR